jgi:hypothetical protein
MRALVGALVGCLCACASAPVVDVQALLAREAPPQRERELTSPDGSFRARVAAEIDEAPSFDAGTYTASLSIGSEYPITCSVHVERLDSAAALSALSDLAQDLIGEHIGLVELRQLQRTDAGVIDGTPFLAAAWLYQVRRGADPVVTEAKLRLAQKAERTISCLHVEMGYHESFERLFAGLVESIEFAEFFNDTATTEIYTMSIDEWPVGYSRGTLTRDDEGDTLVTETSALFIPLGPDSVSTTDSYYIEYSRPDGTLINQVFLEAENGKAISNLRLDPQPGGGWQVDGTFKGKELQVTIESAEPLTSGLGDLVHLRNALQQSGGEARILLRKWLPDLDPTRLLDMKTSVREVLPDERYRADVEVGPMRLDVVLDSEGSTLRSAVSLGAAEMIVERVWQDGGF